MSETCETCGTDFDTVEEWDNHFPEEPDTPKACAYCGTRPQAIGVHCSACWNDLADKAAIEWLRDNA